MKGKLSKTNDKWVVIASVNDELVEYPLHHKELANYNVIFNLFLHHPDVNFDVISEAYDVTKDGQQVLYKDFAILREPTDIEQASIIYSSSSPKDFIIGAEWMKRHSYTEYEIINALRHAEYKHNVSYAKLWTILKIFLENERSNNEP